MLVRLADRPSSTPGKVKHIRKPRRHILFRRTAGCVMVGGPSTVSVEVASWTAPQIAYLEMLQVREQHYGVCNDMPRFCHFTSNVFPALVVRQLCYCAALMRGQVACRVAQRNICASMEVFRNGESVQAEGQDCGLIAGFLASKEQRQRMSLDTQQLARLGDKRVFIDLVPDLGGESAEKWALVLFAACRDAWRAWWEWCKDGAEGRRWCCKKREHVGSECKERLLDLVALKYRFVA